MAFYEVGPKDNKWFINPAHVVRIADASASILEKRKLTKPTAILFLVNGNPDGLAIEGTTAADLVKDINDAITKHLNKEIEKALLG